MSSKDSTPEVTFDTHLTLSWGISKGHETYGYNIARLRDDATGKRFKCMGGGYDMQGTVFANWLQETYQDRLIAIADQAHMTYYSGAGKYTLNESGLYGFTAAVDGKKAWLDGGCGLSSIERIANAIGLRVKHEVNRRGNLIGMVVKDASANA